MNPKKHTLPDMSDINRDLLAPLQGTSWKYFILIGLLGCAVFAGAAAWAYQIRTGIGQTDLHRPIFWGSYIGSFIFWVGVSHSGTFISGVLRLSKAEWRRPITRMAELMTLISIMIAGAFVFYHLGRVWRFYYLFPYPNQRELWPNFLSPLMWDSTAILTYAVASSIYLYLPLIPDFALLRDRIQDWRKPLYHILALGWNNSQAQWHTLETAIRIITPLIVMVMISVHSIVGLDFGVSLVTGWHSTIFPPYFVVGAVHSGIAMVIIGLYFLRKIYRLHDYVRPEHFDKLAKLLVVTTLLLAYLYFAEQHIVWYGNIPDHRSIQQSLVSGAFAMPFWSMIVMIYIVPLFTLTIPRFRTWPFGLMIVGVLINIGMYIERLLIMVPPLVHPHLSFQWSSYFPSPVEMTIMIGSLSLAILLYCLAVKFVPVISIWEEKLGRAKHESPSS
jgi:Ni/Fe-hydrogenase subunit HybB-like protein